MSLPDRLPEQDVNPPAEDWVFGTPASIATATPAARSTAERLSRWEATLVAQRARLQAAQVTLASVREDMRTQRQLNEATSHRLDERARELDARAHDLDLKHQKLLRIARHVKELKTQVAAQAQAEGEASAAVLRDARLTQAQRQQELVSVERNRLAQVVQDLKRERDFLERRVETLEMQAAERTGATRRMSVPQPGEPSFDNVPKHLENANSTPTRVYPAGWRVENPRLSTKVRQGLGNLWEYFTSPVDPTLPPVN